MKTIHRNILIGLWVIIATVFFARWRIRNFDLFPVLPKELWEWLSEIFNVMGHEGQSDLKTSVTLVLSFIVISLSTLLVIYLWHCIKLQYFSDK